MIKSFAITCVVLLLCTASHALAQLTTLKYAGHIRSWKNEGYVTMDVNREPVVRIVGNTKTRIGWRYTGWYSDTLDHSAAGRSDANDVYASISGASKNVIDLVALHGSGEAPIDTGAVYFWVNEDDTTRMLITATFQNDGSLVGTTSPFGGKEEYAFRLTKISEEPYEYDNKDITFDFDFIPFWESFTEAVRNNDKAAVADLTQFPLASDGYCFTGKKKVTKAMFLKAYKDMFADNPVNDFRIKYAWGVNTQYYPEITKSYTVLPKKTVFFQANSGQSYLFYFARVKGKYKLVHVDCAGGC